MVRNGRTDDRLRAFVKRVSLKRKRCFSQKFSRAKLSGALNTWAEFVNANRDCSAALRLELIDSNGDATRLLDGNSRHAMSAGYELGLFHNRERGRVDWHPIDIDDFQVR